MLEVLAYIRYCLSRVLVPQLLILIHETHSPPTQTPVLLTIAANCKQKVLQLVVKESKQRLLLQVHLLLRDHASSPTLLLWMTQLMAGGVTADTADGSGVPMLCSAAAAGNKAVVKWLLDSGAYASAAATSGRGPLHYAAKGSIHHVEAIRESYDLPPLFNGATPGPVTSSMARRSTGSTQPAAASTYVVSGRRTSADGAATRGQGAGVSLFQALKDVATAYAQVIDTLVVRPPHTCQ